MVNGRDQSDELQQLRAQVAELTRRVYHLEGLLGARAEQPAAPTAVQPDIVAAHETPAPATVPLPPTAARPAAQPTASLESRIGGQWLNRVGIVAVLIGLSYFLKLAFENNWIGPATQVLIGMAAGIGLLFWSERFRNKGYAGFAYSLKAVSFGALYLSLWAASQYYHLVPPAVTFIAMVLVTLTAAALSLRQNAGPLAAFALVGGFLTPVLISTGQNHEIALCCYLALLDLGTLWLTAIRKWYGLLLGAYFGTAILAGAWAASYYTDAQLTPTILFATFFFLLFATSPCLDRAHPVPPLREGILSALVPLNAAGYFAACYLMLERDYHAELAWLSLALAAFFFFLARMLERRRAGAAAALHLAIAIGFLTIAIPLKLRAQWITLGWLVEAAALAWAAHRGRGQVLRAFGAVALVMGILRLVLVDSDARQPLIFNARFGLYLVAIAALALIACYARLEGGDENRQWAGAAIIALNVLALLALHFEVMDYFRPGAIHVYTAAQWRTLNIARDFTYSAIWMLYGGGLMLVGFWKRSAFLRWQAIVLLALTAAKVFFYDISALERGYRIVAFMVLGAILLAVSFFYQRSRLKTAG